MILRRALSLAFTLALLAIAKPAGTLDLPLPGPAPRARLESVAGVGMPSDDRCAGCHREIAAEWRSSLHHHAWQNEYFLRSYALEPLPFCRKCHAPLADPALEPPPAAQKIGVGCTTCHVVPAGIVGAHAKTRSADRHEVIGDARLQTPAACAACHQFALPAPPGFDAGPMQDTLGEHQRSAAARTSCQDCHMPLVQNQGAPGGRAHRSHRFRVQGDREKLAQAVTVTSATLYPNELRLSLAPGAIGHAFPTGDLHRGVELRAIPIDSSGRALAKGSSMVLGRSFGPKRVGTSTLVRVELSDTRLIRPQRFVLPLPHATKRARWQIVWQRLPPALATRLEMKMDDNEMVVLEGVVSR